jgi:hypothetical protein
MKLPSRRQVVQTQATLHQIPTRLDLLPIIPTKPPMPTPTRTSILWGLNIQICINRRWDTHRIYPGGVILATMQKIQQLRQSIVEKVKEGLRRDEQYPASAAFRQWSSVAAVVPLSILCAEKVAPFVFLAPSAKAIIARKFCCVMD